MILKLRRALRSNLTVYHVFVRIRNRYRIFRYGLTSVHPTFHISPRSRISRDLVAGEFGFIGEGCQIGPRVELECYVMFGPRVAIVGGDHRFDRVGIPMIFSGRPELEATKVEADVWVGYGAIIMAGVRIGRGTIIAAGAVVTQNVPAYEIWGGIPARKLRDRFNNEEDRRIHDQMLHRQPREGEYAQPRFSDAGV